LATLLRRASKRLETKITTCSTKVEEQKAGKDEKKFAFLMPILRSQQQQHQHSFLGRSKSCHKYFNFAFFTEFKEEISFSFYIPLADLAREANWPLSHDWLEK
jgi:hypothetical protein